MINDKNSEPLLQAIVQRLLAAGQPQKIILFGSQAQGQAGCDSDYDLLLIENSSQPRYRRARFLSPCPERLGNIQRYYRMDTQ
jgi:predicted nucleotidyltransferase